MKKYGWRQPLLVDFKSGEIIAGHGRFLAAKQLKMTEIPCIDCSDMTEEQMREYRYLDNKLNESAWDFDILREDLASFNFAGFDLDWQGLETSGVPEVREDGYNPEENLPERARPGELWQLGRHRLLVGDSTVRADVEKLCGGIRSKLLFTSPSYADMRDYTTGGIGLSVEHLAKFIPPD